MCKISRILVIDNNRCVTKQLKELLEYEKYSVVIAGDATEAERALKVGTFDLIICDADIKVSNVKYAYEHYLELFPQSNVILLAEKPNTDWIIYAIKKGVYDIICKPIQSPNKLFSDIRDITNYAEEEKGRVPSIKQKDKTPITNAPIIIGDCKHTTRLKEMISIVAPTDARVLIMGANGTGKELVAKCIHAQSTRRDMPLIEVNCAAIPNELIESEMFGHEKGSFTGAIGQRKGRFELAHGGTIFLDEIGDMSLQAQSKLLRVLQEHRITRVGGEKDFEVDVRIIAATNKNLIEEIDNKNFREDLYHRLSVVSFTVPSLDDRRDDIPALIKYFIKEICTLYHKEVLTIDDDAIDMLKNRHWRGNIRELHNMIERLILFSKETITSREIRIYIDNLLE
ncbi:MAG: sigma-54 dependent transcriptional regulator [Rikenellaceae bacterium]